MNRFKWCFLVVFLLPITARATVTDANYLVRGDDTLRLLTYPLVRYAQLAEVRDDSARSQQFYEALSGGIGTIGYWELSHDTLYLTRLFVYKGSGVNLPVDLALLFPNRYSGGKVRADWVEGELMIPVGELIHYYGTPANSSYEGEIILTMKDGTLVKEEQFDNSGNYQSRFTKSARVFHEYLYSHIDWSIIPNLGDKKVKVFLQIIAGDRPRPDSVVFLKKSYYPPLDQEAMHVLKSLPEWDMYYRRGKPEPVPWMVTVVFDEKTRREYAR
ncbi:hypothetical protein [Persicitalea jodogahamensis]|uniref:TonB C-terminal domain-containing protein n=1 Tax=Persicitalea jodogahamensis TaxID=402147 RepID=A0A8J3D2P2_9BACT|nr:hypothetical protein [Persicitalea jodogahamensis]GHB60277.1 hypothetical protein GCM10007390_12500 [Persicitalea jodogahamensis]